MVPFLVGHLKIFIWNLKYVYKQYIYAHYVKLHYINKHTYILKCSLLSKYYLKPLYTFGSKF